MGSNGRIAQQIHGVDLISCNDIFIRFFPSGDEILAINGKPLHGSSHKEAILAFKEIKQGKVVLHIGRRRKKKAVAHQ